MNNIKEYELEEMALKEDFIKNTNIDFQEFLNSTYKLETKHKDIINDFYKKAFTSPEKLTYVDTYPEYMEACGNYRYRFLLLKYKNDFLFVNMKVIDPRNSTGRYFHIYHPISYNRDKNNELWLIKSLAKFQYIKSYVQLNESGDYTEWCNNYYNTQETCEFMFKSKWRSKHCIKKLDDIVSTEFIDYDAGNLEGEIMDFYDRWESIRKFNERKPTRKLVQMMNKNEDIKMCVMRVAGKIVAFNIVLTYLNKYAVVHIAKYISVADEYYLMDYLGVDFDKAKLFRYNLSAYVQYKNHEWYLKNKGFEAFYYEGDTHLKWLRAYKKMFFRKMIFYKRIPIEDYIKSLEE